MVIISMIWVVNKKDIKVRIYEDDEETTVVDFNNAINRKVKKSVAYSVVDT